MSGAEIASASEHNIPGSSMVNQRIEPTGHCQFYDERQAHCANHDIIDRERNMRREFEHYRMSRSMGSHHHADGERGLHEIREVIEICRRRRGEMHGERCPRFKPLMMKVIERIIPQYMPENTSSNSKDYLKGVKNKTLKAVKIRQNGNKK